MNYFLKAKHWQLFLFIFGLPIAGRILSFTIYFFTNNNLILFSKPILLLSTVLNFISLLVLFCWMWSVGVILNKKTPASLKMQVTYFKIAILIPFFICSSLAIWYQITFGEYGYQLDIIGFAFFILFIYVILLFIILLFPITYCIYFIAKTIKILELKRSPKISDYIYEIILIVAFPIGIWYLQPIINDIYKKTITH